MSSEFADSDVCLAWPRGEAPARHDGRTGAPLDAGGAPAPGAAPVSSARIFADCFEPLRAVLAGCRPEVLPDALRTGVPLSVAKAAVARYRASAEAFDAAT